MAKIKIKHLDPEQNQVQIVNPLHRKLSITLFKELTMYHSLQKKKKKKKNNKKINKIFTKC